MEPTESPLAARSGAAALAPACLTAPPLNEGGPWPLMQEQARRQAVAEPLLAAYLQMRVLQYASAEAALTHLLAAKLAAPGLDEGPLSGLIRQCFTEAPNLAHCLQRDLAAVIERDPAARDRVNVLLNQKGFQALQAHRVAHHLWCTYRPGLALFFQGRTAEVYAMDVHPAARIGSGVFIDHGTGLVVGETAVVGNDCTMFQEVTLGGTGKDAGDRHPKVGRGVLLCAGAKVLGNVQIGDGAKIGAASVVLIDVPPGATAVGVPATIVTRQQCAPHAPADVA